MFGSHGSSVYYMAALAASAVRGRHVHTKAFYKAHQPHRRFIESCERYDKARQGPEKKEKAMTHVAQPDRPWVVLIDLQAQFFKVRGWSKGS